MKIGYLVGAISLTVLILIIAFQNITMKSSFVMFFNIESTPMTFPILLISVISMIAGALYTMFLKSMIIEKKEEREEDIDTGF